MMLRLDRCDRPVRPAAGAPPLTRGAYESAFSKNASA